MAHRRLVRVVRLRQPSLIDGLRERPRRWYDPSDAALVQQTKVRKHFRELVMPLAAGDKEIASRLAEVEAAERVLRAGMWLGLAVTVLLVILAIVRFR